MGAPKELERMAREINWSGVSTTISNNPSTSLAPKTKNKTLNTTSSTSSLKRSSKSKFNEVDKEFEENCIQYILSTKIAEDLELSPTDYIQDKEIQKKGVDLITNYKGNEIKIDVKSIAQYDFKTFCFELLNSNSGARGWLFNEDLDTTHFLLTYHHVVDGTNDYAEDKKILKYDNIDKTFALLLDKKKVQELIMNHVNGMDYRILTYEILANTSRQTYGTAALIFENGNFILKDSNMDYDKFSNSIRFTRSNKIYERPINAVIPRTFLEEIADEKWIIEEKI